MSKSPKGLFIVEVETIHQTFASQLEHWEDMQRNIMLPKTYIPYETPVAELYRLAHQNLIYYLDLPDFSEGYVDVFEFRPRFGTCTFTKARFYVEGRNPDAS